MHFAKNCAYIAIIKTMHRSIIHVELRECMYIHVVIVRNWSGQWVNCVRMSTFVVLIVYQWLGDKVT